jgi:phenylpyruvate tautomerase PptA (4-oxalocrotonate tautomerase family)
MPLWTFTCYKDLLSEEEKISLARDVTALYSAVPLPKFYVNVQFNEKDKTGMLVGGEFKRNWVSLSIVHIARTFNTETDRADFLKRIDEILSRLRDKDIHYEYYIIDTLRQQWKIDGMYPPPSDSLAEKQWAAQNYPSPHSRGHLPSMHSML